MCPGADLELEKQSVTVKESWKGWSQNTPDSALPEMAQPEQPSLLATTVTCLGQPTATAESSQYMACQHIPSCKDTELKGAARANSTRLFGRLTTAHAQEISLSIVRTTTAASTGVFSGMQFHTVGSLTGML